MSITIERLLKECDLDENGLRAKIEREHFPHISGCLTEWRVLALTLSDFDQSVVADIETKRREEEKRLEFLEQLKQRHSLDATYELLVRNLLEIKRADDAQKLCGHLKKLIGSRQDQGVDSSTVQLGILKKKDENIQQKFREVVQAVQKSFSERKVDLSDILSSLQFIQCPKERELIETKLEDLNKVQSLYMLFFSLSCIWNYLHPGLLEFIVDSYGTDNDKSRVKEYMVALEKYRGSVKLGDFVKITCKKKTPQQFNKEFSVEVGEDWRHKTLQDMEDVRLLVADEAKVNNLLFRTSPRQSHFTIVFSMPSWVQLNLVDMYPILSTIGATKVYLNNDYIYECVPLKKEANEALLGNESVIYSQIKEVQYFQSDVSKMLSPLLYISKPDFEQLVDQVSAAFTEEDEKAILDLRQGHKRYNCPSNLQAMFYEKEILKSVPGSFRAVLKKIKRIDLLSTVEEFYNNRTKPNIITESSVCQQFESIHEIMASVITSLWNFEEDIQTSHLTYLSSELESIFYHAYILYESIQGAILEFSVKQSKERKRGISEEIKTATKKPKVTFSEANGSKTSPLRGSKASPLQRSKASPLQRSKFSRLQRCKGPAKLHCPVCRKKDCGECVHCRYHSNHQACLRKPRNKCITYFQPYLKRTSQGMCAAKAFDKCNPSTDLKVNIKAIEPVVKIASSSLTPALETPSKAATVVFPIKTEKANTLATLYYNPLATISSKQETDSTVSNPFQISTGDYQVNETSSVLQINKDLSSIIFSMNSNLEDLKCFQGKLNKCLFDQLSGNIKSDKGMSKLQSYETSGEANITSLKDELKEKSDDVTMAKLYPEPAHVAFSEELQTDHSSAEYFHRVVKESISQLSVNLYITKCGISGPPSTGKTHFRELLLGRRRPSQRQSTALSTSAVEVINADLVSTTKRKSGAFKWTVLEKDPWMRLLANTIYEDLLKKGILKEKLNWSELESTFNNLADFSKNVLSHLSSNVKKNKEGNKSAGEKSALKTLSGSHLLYLVDTGGQPQFHEILPHFLRSSIYFLVHNLSEDLMHCPEFEYTIDDCQYSVPEAMKMSNKSIIEQAAQSACSTYHTDIFSKRTPAVAIIGMFKDKCDDVDKTLHKKSKEIKEVLMHLTGSKTKCDIIEYSRDQCIFPFDASEKSWNKNGNILEKLKNRVDMYAHGDPSDIKLSHFIFLQNLKKIGKKEPFIMIHKCEDIARNSYVPLENTEMYEALHLFHEVNLILYFRESEEVNDLVFLDPNYLFQMVTDIIVQSFDKPFETNEDFQKSGTFTRELLLNIPRMRELSGKPDSKFSLDKFLCIMQQLCIISKLPDASYFMPCVLQMENPQNPTPECTRRLDDIQKRMTKNHVSGPLIISFGDRVLPRGLFCAMVVILSNNYGLQLKTDSESICRRNLIEFSVDTTESGSSSQAISLASTVIFDKITHIEVLTTCSSDNCFLISQALELALYEACKILKYNPANFGIERGFNCNIGHSSANHHTVVSKNTNKKFVQKCCKNLMGRGKLLEREHLVWFHSNKEYPKEVEIENFGTLIEKLVPITNQWENIGVRLELTATELDRIRIDYHNEKSRFRQVLAIWKKHGSPPYTWNTIIDVLNSPLVKEDVLAEELATKYYS